MSTPERPHGPDPRLPAPAAPQDERHRVLDAEVLGPNDDNDDREYTHQYQQQAGPHQVFGRVWTSGTDQRACLAPVGSLFLFLVCVIRFGLLAGIGFAVFLLIGGAVGSMVQLRMLMEGRRPNPWLWRAGNWLVSFSLAAWLAGGLG
ncbi:MAG: hypothetical protein Q4F27_05515 [Desulfovibrionaceae bacterium]|nr:hypothetical protein [Desulfovibrionaceae bacterium]